MGDAKILEFPCRISGVADERSGKLLERSLEVLLEVLEPLFPRLHADVDDALFDMADAAANNRGQMACLDAARTYRLVSGRIWPEFARAMQRGCCRYLEGLPLAEENGGGGGELELVDQRELEERLAVLTLAQKAETVSAHLLESLGARLGHMRDAGAGERLPIEENPLGPLAVASAFQAALKAWDGEMMARLVVYRRFEKLVSPVLPAVYEEIDRMLAENGVLPELKPGRALRRAAESSGATREADSLGEEGSEPAGPETGWGGPVGFVVDPAVLSRLWREMHAGNGGGVIPLPVLPNLPVMSQGEVAKALDSVQARLADMDGLESMDLGQRQDLLQRLLLRALGQEEPEKAERRLAEGDHQTLDLILALFNEVLDDPDLPNAMRAEIGRLQIPVLKAAIQDPKGGFLENEKHPARRFIDSLAKAGIGIEAQGERLAEEFYGKVRQIVSRVVSSEEGGVSPFLGAQRDLDRYLGELESRRRRMEQHARQQADGEDRRAAAEAAVLEGLRGWDLGALPDPVQEFVIGPWRRLLVVIRLREGEEGKGYQSAMGLVQELHELLTHDLYLEDPGQFVERMNLLIERVRRGLEFLHIKGRRADSILRTLGLYRDEARKLLPEVRERRMQAPLGEQEAARNAVPREKDEHDRLVESLEEGQWVRFLPDERNGKAMVCKLAWHSPYTGTYLFVNGLGRETLKIKGPDLAVRFRGGRAQLVENADAPWLSRVLNSLFQRWGGRPGMDGEETQEAATA